MTLPPPEDLPALLLDLAVPHEDIDDVVAARPGPERGPLLERLTRYLVDGIGRIEPPEPLPPDLLPDDLDRFFLVYVFLAALPRLRAYHDRLGIPERISRLTLTDLGRAMARYRQAHGSGGFDLAWWLVLHFRGVLYQLGRLQYQRDRLAPEPADLPGVPVAAGEPVLNLHIPWFFGPLSPAACDASLAAAGPFFARHFPDERYTTVVCYSWLLDPQLARYLPDGSNILRFQRRFHRPEGWRQETDDTIVRYVFGRVPERLTDLPRRTTLERAVVDHLQAGGHWYSTGGWLSLDDAPGAVARAG